MQLRASYYQPMGLPMALLAIYCYFLFSIFCRVQLLPWHSKPLTEFENARHSMPIDEWGHKTPPIHKKFTILPSKKRGSVTNTSLLSSDQLQGFENLFTHALGQNGFRNVLHGVTDSPQVVKTRGMVLVRLLKTRAALNHCARLGFALNAFAFFKEWHKRKDYFRRASTSFLGGRRP